MTTADIRLEMVSNPIYLCGARELVSAVAGRLGFSREGCAQVALAVDEALCNVMRHGYQKRKDGPIWVSLSPIVNGTGEATGLRIVIEDEAQQVDPSAIRGRDLDEIRPGGLGVHIIREVMDEAVYQKRDGAGMRLTLVKHIGSDTGSARKAGGGSGCACGESGT